MSESDISEVGTTESASERGKRVIASLMDLGKRTGLEVQAEYPLFQTALLAFSSTSSFDGPDGSHEPSIARRDPARQRRTM